MKVTIDDIIRSIGNAYEGRIAPNARHYLEINMEREAAKRGDSDFAATLKGVYAIVPLNAPEGGMKVRIDGRTFKRYQQFDSGVAVPGYVAEKARLARKPYVPNDSMILNFQEA